MARGLHIYRKLQVTKRSPRGPVRKPHSQKRRPLFPAKAPQAHYAKTVSAKTVFVWPRFGLQCGVAEFAYHLAAVSDNAACCKHPYEIQHTEHAVLVLMPSLTSYDLEVVRYLRRMGARVTLDIHHFSAGGNPFQVLAREATDAVWHHPRIPGLAGFGRYVPLPVPTLPRDEVARVGGLTHFGLGTPYKRFDVMASVARDLGTRLHVYGSKNGGFVPAPLRPFVAVDDSYPSDLELARRLRQHDVGMIGRLPWGGTQINGSASARFFVGAGVPAVIDAAAAHEDLTDVLDVVPYNDFAATRERVRLLLENPDYRAEALARADAYAIKTSPTAVAQQMGIHCRES